MPSSSPVPTTHRTAAMLVIDTALRPGFLGLWRTNAPAEAGWLAFRAFSHGRRQGEEIFPFLQDMLAEAQLSLHHLSGIAATTGPGSFSALRIGLGAAKSLCETAGLPLCGVSLLDVAASLAPEQASVVLLRASRTDVYLAGFDHHGHILATPEIVTLSQWRLPAAWAPRSVVLGEPSLAEECVSHPDLASLPTLLTDEHFPARIASTAWQRLQAGVLDNPISLDALYVRRQNAGDAWVDPRLAAGQL